jgi:hypothetical protein
MNKSITLDDLILFAYNETGDKKSGEILNTLDENEELRVEYQSICDIQNELDFFKAEPQQGIINNILNYSRALNIFNVSPDVETAMFIVN